MFLTSLEGTQHQFTSMLMTETCNLSRQLFGQKQTVSVRWMSGRAPVDCGWIQRRRSWYGLVPNCSRKVEHQWYRRVVFNWLANLVQQHTSCTLRSASANPFSLSYSCCNLSFGARGFPSAALLLLGIVRPLTSVLAKLCQHSADTWNLIFSIYFFQLPNYPPQRLW